MAKFCRTSLPISFEHVRAVTIMGVVLHRSLSFRDHRSPPHLVVCEGLTPLVFFFSEAWVVGDLSALGGANNLVVVFVIA